MLVSKIYHVNARRPKWKISRENLEHGVEFKNLKNLPAFRDSNHFRMEFQAHQKSHNASKECRTEEAQQSQMAQGL
jgi:hypothetical protein